MVKSRHIPLEINGTVRCERDREIEVPEFAEDGYTPLRIRRMKQRCNRRLCECTCSVCGCELEHQQFGIPRKCGCKGKRR